jgi:ferritin
MIPVSDRLSDMINQQIGRELGNSFLYEIFASWAHIRGLKNVQKFFLGESSGERDHAALLKKTLDDANIQVAIPNIPQKLSVYVDCESIARAYEDAEAETTDFLDELYKSAESEGNIGVSNVLQGMLEEQIEEQGLTERFKNLVHQANGNLLILDLMFEE